MPTLMACRLRPFVSRVGTHPAGRQLNRILRLAMTLRVASTGQCHDISDCTPEGFHFKLEVGKGIEPLRR